MHANVERLQKLLGVWRGEGHGQYPTIKAFAYGEEITFAHPNPAKPVVAYSHKTWRNDETKTPMHAESGYLRVQNDGKVLFACAQVTGLAEASDGDWNDKASTLTLSSSSVGNAAKVQQIERRYHLGNNNDELTYIISMRTHEQPLQEHLRATLKRVS